MTASQSERCRGAGEDAATGFLHSAPCGESLGRLPDWPWRLNIGSVLEIFLLRWPQLSPPPPKDEPYDRAVRTIVALSTPTMSASFNRRSNISVSSRPTAAGGNSVLQMAKCEPAAKESICLISVCDQAYAEVADANKQAYCDKHGYTYRSFRASLDTSRHIAWSKVIAVLQLLPEFTWVMQGRTLRAAALVVPQLAPPDASDATRLQVSFATHPGGAPRPEPNGSM